MAEVIRLLQATFLYLLVFAPEAEAVTSTRNIPEIANAVFYAIGIPPFTEEDTKSVNRYLHISL